MGRKKFETSDDLYDPVKAQLIAEATRKKEPPVVSKEKRVVPVAPPPPVTLQTAPMPEPKPEPSRPERALYKKAKKRILSCADGEQDEELDSFINRLRACSNTSISLAVLFRALIIQMMRSEENIRLELERHPSPSQPATHQKRAYAEFEEFWTNIIGESFRRLRPGQKNTDI